MNRALLLNITMWLFFLFILTISFNLSFGILILLPCILPFYLNNYLIEKYYLKRRFYIYFTFVALIAIAFGLFAELLNSLITDPNDILYNYILPADIISDSIYRPDVIPGRFGITAFLNPLFAMIIGSITMAIRIRHEKRIDYLQMQNKAAELELLRSKINPHFLFNTLNNLYSMAYSGQNSDTADGIGRLSHLMRYMIYDSEKEYISVGMEIEHIKDYLNLQELRIENDRKESIKFTYDAEIEKYSVPPMIFMPFIENAFKYGLDVNREFKIAIGIEMTGESKLKFCITNTINPDSLFTNEREKGFGISNVRKRLDLLYSQDYHLAISNDSQIFEVNLIIPVS